MMPLLTWGTSNVDFRKVADASSLLTSFRTIAGSVGSALFVGIMTAVSAASQASYGDRALVHGMNRLSGFIWRQGFSPWYEHLFPVHGSRSFRSFTDRSICGEKN